MAKSFFQKWVKHKKIVMNEARHPARDALPVHVNSGKGFYQISGNLPRSLRHVVHDALNANHPVQLKRTSDDDDDDDDTCRKEQKLRLAKLCPQ